MRHALRCVFAVCATLVLTSAVDAQLAPLPENHKAYNALAWMQNAAEYQLAVRQAYRYARRQLTAGLQDQVWSADLVQLECGNFADKPPAVILDVDETVLSNSPYNARLILDGTRFTQETWQAWAREEKAQAIPGSLEFVKNAKEAGASVFFVTNRHDAIKQATINNLRKVGFCADEMNVLTRNDDDGRGGDKASRRAMVAKTHRIVLLIGDNLNDLCSGARTDDQVARNATALANVRVVGDRWVLLPNPVHGGWTSPFRKLPEPADVLDPRR